VTSNPEEPPKRKFSDETPDGLGAKKPKVDNTSKCLTEDETVKLEAVELSIYRATAKFYKSPENLQVILIKEMLELRWRC
jgi:hypothetical protein